MKLSKRIVRKTKLFTVDIINIVLRRYKFILHEINKENICVLISNKEDYKNSSDNQILNFRKIKNWLFTKHYLLSIRWMVKANPRYNKDINKYPNTRNTFEVLNKCKSSASRATKQVSFF